MDTTENNRLISEFMGMKPNRYNSFPLKPTDFAQDGDADVRYSDMKYHKSWDWLMPVIDKIRSEVCYVKYKEHTASMIDDGGIYINTKFRENTYNDVVEFIKWYNQNKED